MPPFMTPKHISCPGRASARISGFTLIELLTVIAIIGILAAIIIPTVGKVRDKAKSIDCSNRIRSWAVAANLFAAENKSRYVIVNESGVLWCQIGSPGVTGSGGIYIPYFSKGSIREYGDDLMSCPSAEGQAEYQTARAVGTNTPFFFAYAIGLPHVNNVTIPASGRALYVPLAKARQPSRTILFIERAYVAGGSAYDTGANATINKEGSQIAAAYQVYSRHNKRIHTAFLDGHVKGMAWSDIDLNTSLSKGSGRSSAFNTDWLKLD
jgi:prepilin-type N-terminal cleavage/methylation domain-containing protein/prepilin-type processing-associated H-X9-DG protein